MSFSGQVSYNQKPATPKSKRSNSPESLQKTLSRPGSASLINKCLYRLLGEPPKCHGNLSRKIETLEKQQDRWKERAQAWEKEKKSYCSALESVSFTQLSKNSADYYKEHLQQWNDSKIQKKVESEVQGVIEWIKRQEEPVLAQIREVVGEKSRSTLNGSFLLGNENMDNCLKDLMEKNEQLSTSLCQIESELKSKVQGVESLKKALERLKKEINEKESALLEEKHLNEALMSRISELGDDGKVLELKEELEGKELEIVVLKTQNTQLQCSILEFQQSNQVYLKTVEELKKKLQVRRVESCGDDSFGTISSLEELEEFEDECFESVAVQCEVESEGFEYLKCMALALEGVLMSQKDPFN